MTTTDPERALDHLERWLPFLQWEPAPVLDPDVMDALERHAASSGRDGRARRKPLRLGIDGECVRVRTRRRPASDGGLYARLLESRQPALSKALESLRRLETLLAGTHAQREAAIVLIVTYLSAGSQVRAQWQQEGGVALWTAYVCADAETRRAWILTPSKSLGTRLALRYGEALLTAARAAWYDLPADAGRPVHGRGRLRLEHVRDVVSRAVCAAQADIDASKAVRKSWRDARRKAVREAA